MAAPLLPLETGAHHSEDPPPPRTFVQQCIERCCPWHPPAPTPALPPPPLPPPAVAQTPQLGQIQASIRQQLDDISRTPRSATPAAVLWLGGGAARAEAFAAPSAAVRPAMLWLASRAYAEDAARESPASSGWQDHIAGHGLMGFDFASKVA
mmetsp:Transcript_120965/g.301851  ORF Transcript_120965/g.301851 Transcript_120965/m.301851 type:complete len:152 (+) Transcript_120965:166-621(+)